MYNRGSIVHMLSCVHMKPLASFILMAIFAVSSGISAGRGAWILAVIYGLAAVVIWNTMTDKAG